MVRQGGGGKLPCGADADVRREGADKSVGVNGIASTLSKAEAVTRVAVAKLEAVVEVSGNITETFEDVEAGGDTYSDIALQNHAPCRLSPYCQNLWV